MTTSNTTTSVGNSAGNDNAPQSQQATGGNGGEQLTQNTGNIRRDQADTAEAGNRQSGQPKTDATAANRTAQDTRGNQAGSSGTGLGAAEVGGNQDEFDMPKE